MEENDAWSRVWHPLYPQGVPAAIDLPAPTILSMFDERVAADPEAPSLHYFGRTMTRGEVAELSDVLAGGLRERGVAPGDRVAVALQNTPVFVICALAAWKADATVVPVNPMLRTRELSHVVDDSGCVVLVADPAMRDVVESVCAGAARLRHVLWSHPADLAGGMPGNWAPAPEGQSRDESVLSILDSGRRPPESCEVTRDLALLTYTSGTTGPSKGAMNRHQGLVYEAAAGRAWFGLDSDDVVLAIAPLFHITGLGVHLALALGNGIPLVLTHRFDPRVVAALTARYRPTFTVGALTAFISLLDEETADATAMGSLGNVHSGGAPVSAAVVRRYEEAYGVYVHNIYGLTETTSACIGVPLGQQAPVDDASGAVSIGVPLPGTDVRILDEQGEALAPGELGEICVRGPQVVEGYWQRPDESAKAIRGGWLHTGDVGFMDEQGWIFIVDRKKDMIVVSGYKVWPREVEDVLYEHPVIQEAAVVGVPDSYRGETVHAYVTVRPGESVSAGELEAHCRDRLSAYKCPRAFRVVSELPKTATGKILRRTLRDEAASSEPGR
ncbi:AMP-binding protein [Micromonospora sp. NPDC005206]|uniref:AMP-binding protein n=1 Tax=Micromonospora sp. NPDC005206 TaxID=3157022 RepID=UPI0033BD2CA7